MFRYIITGLLFILCFHLNAQDKLIDRAHADFEDGNYVRALKNYKKALKTNQDLRTRRVLITQVARSLQHMNAYEEALPWFEQVVADRRAEAGLYLAYGNSLLHLKKYQEAHEIFKKGQNTYKNNKALKHKLQLCTFYLDTNLYHKSRNKVENVQSLNSPYSDFAPAWFEDKLVVTSSRITTDNSKIDGRTNQAYSELYISVYDPHTDNWEQPYPAPKNINHLFNDGVFTYDEINAVAYFMRCNSRNKSSCKIFETQYSFDGNWSDPVALPFMTKGHDYGHPAVSYDGRTLFFVSDMPGGYGGKDLWKISRIEDNQWGIPTNLGAEVNSEFDELFPFVLGDSVLFFASERNTGYGGLDVYAAINHSSNWSNAVLLPLPVNSAADDFSLIIRENTLGGLMSSNRDNTENSDDIFSFGKYPLTINYHGKVFDQETKIPIENAQLIFSCMEYPSDTITSAADGSFSYEIPAYLNYTVQILKPGFINEFDQLAFYNPELVYSDERKLEKDFQLATYTQSVKIAGKVIERGTDKPIGGQQITMISSYGRIDTTFTDQKGNYHYKGLKPGADYTVRIAREGYFSESRKCKIAAKTKVTTFSKATGYDMDFELTRIQEQEEILINNIFYDFDKASLRWESRIELDKIASMLVETPGVVIQINSHTDARGSNTYNDRLSSERAQSVVNYLINKGIPTDRLLAKGHGKRNLLIKYARTEDDHQLNRRTSFNILSVDPSMMQPKQHRTPHNIKTNQNTPQDMAGLSYRIQLLASSQKHDPNVKFANLIQSLPNVDIFINSSGNIHRYELGERSTITEIRKLKRQLSGLGYQDCFITAYYNNEKISMDEARNIMKQ